jgi:hypothetical protein
MEVYKEGISMEGANIDDSLTRADADIREDERLEVVWRRVDEGEEDEVQTKEGEARKRHSDWDPRYIQRQYGTKQGSG